MRLTTNKKRKSACTLHFLLLTSWISEHYAVYARLHYAYTLLALTYTTLALYLHLHYCYVSQHREVERAFGVTEYSTSPYTNTAMAQPQIRQGVQASCAGRCVHKNDYCLHTWKRWLPTRYDKKCKVQAKSPNKYLGLCTCTLCTK